MKNSNYSTLIENFPQEMKSMKDWVNIKGSKKIPVQKNGKPLKWINPEYRHSFEQVQMYSKENAPNMGAGFVIDENNILVIDLDCCLDNNGQLKSWASAILDKINSFTEYSYSGKGLHIFCKHKKIIPFKNKISLGNGKEGIEIYTKRKVITVTGKIWNNRNELNEISQETIDEIIKIYSTKSLSTKKTSLKNDFEIIEELQKTKGFLELYNGNISYLNNDISRCDYKLAFLISTKTKDSFQIERIMNGSALSNMEHSDGTKKWIENDNYRQTTISKALNDSIKTYNPPEKPQNKESYLNIAENTKLSIKEILIERSRKQSKEQPPEMKWIIKNLLQRGIVGSLNAGGGVGKSMLLIHLACAIASGKQWGCFIPEKPLTVLYLAGESDEDGLHRRIYKVRERMGLRHDENCIKNFLSIPNNGYQGQIHLTEEGKPSTNFEWLKKTIIEVKPDILIIDTLSRFAGINENDNKQGAMFIQCLESLLRAGNPKNPMSILFAHHKSKDSRNSYDNGGRGAGSLDDNSRLSLSLKELSLDEKTAKGFKQQAKHIGLFISKINEGKPWNEYESFMFEDDGTLVHVHSNYIDQKIEELCKLLKNAQLTKSQITNLRVKEKESGKIDIKELLEVSKKDIEIILETGFRKGKLQQIEETCCNGNKVLYVVPI